MAGRVLATGRPQATSGCAVSSLGVHPQEATSEGSDSESSAAEGLKRGASWIKSLGRRRRSDGTSRSRSRGKRGAGRNGGGSSDDSGEGPLTSGSSEGGEDGGEEDDDGGLLLGKGAR